jgi:hypothetical protein
MEDKVTIKSPRWRAEKGGKYFYVCSLDGISYENDDYGYSDNRNYNSGNYFRTEEEAKNSKFYKVFHEED